MSYNPKQASEKKGPAQRATDGRTRTPVLILKGGCALPPLHHFLHFNLALCVTFCRRRGQRVQEGSPAQASLCPAFCLPPAAKALSSTTFLTAYLAAPLFLATWAQKVAFPPVHPVRQSAGGLQPQRPQRVLASECSAVGSEAGVTSGDVFVIFQHYLQPTLWPHGLSQKQIKCDRQMKMKKKKEM